MIAHRGASGYAPEHTMQAYKLAAELGADYLEIDLQMTKDGTLVAMHDDSVNRTTNGNGLVRVYTIKELKKLDAGSWFNKMYPEYADDMYVGAKVPTLDEVFKEFGNSVNYYIELKQPEENPGMENKLIRLLKKHRLLVDGNLFNDKVIIQSFSKESLLKLHEKYPELPLIQLVWFDGTPSFTQEEIEEIQSYSVGIGINYKNLNKDLVDELKVKELLIHPYTVDKKSELKKLMELGVDGVFTNYADIQSKGHN